MDLQIPPVAKGEFLYRDVLLVDVGGDLKRHARASPADLKPFLDGTAPKDQVAHWYEAQLVHYGLQRSKDKNTAKVRLQQASNQKKLVVPPHLVDLEAQMRKEYAGNVRKAKNAVAKATENGTLEGAKAKGTGRKRKADDDEVAGGPSASAKKTKITMTIDGMEISIDKESAEVAGKGGVAKKAAKEAATPAKKASAKTQSATPGAEQPQPNAKTKTPRAKAQPTNNATAIDEPPTQSQAKPTAKPKAQPKAKAEPKPKAEPKAKSEPKVKAETKAKSEPKVKPEPNSKPESKPKKEPATKREPNVKPEPSEDAEDPGPRIITGIYTITCADLMIDSPDDLQLSLCVDNASDKIWGAFTLANKFGLLLINEPFTGTEQPMSLGWRARDGENGRLSFGRGCFGDVVFFGEDEFEMTLSNISDGPARLYGRRNAGPLWCGRDAGSFQREWDGYVREAYGR